MKGAIHSNLDRVEHLLAMTIVHEECHAHKQRKKDKARVIKQLRVDHDEWQAQFSAQIQEFHQLVTELSDKLEKQELA